jgi:nicotinate-nucleotide pyrophosphorylase (carboxylating)
MGNSAMSVAADLDPYAGSAMTAVPSRAELLDLVRSALEEDVGSGDVTTNATVDGATRARATIVQKAPGVVYGLDAAEAAFTLLDPHARFERLASEGVWREQGGSRSGPEGGGPEPEGGPGLEGAPGPDSGPVLAVEGSARALLTAERTALNFLGHLSGVATMAARAVRAVEGTGARVLDTRKTTPGLRALEKAAVAAGGATNHRAGLYDAILIKENHIAAAGGIAQAVARARAAAPELAQTLEVEVRDPAEIEQALAAGVPRLLLDNMDDEGLRAAVAQVAGRAQLEASGGVTLQTLGERARTGVEWISMGALTHSAPALDLSLTLEVLP